MGDEKELDEKEGQILEETEGSACWSEVADYNSSHTQLPRDINGCVGWSGLVQRICNG